MRKLVAALLLSLISLPAMAQTSQLVPQAKLLVEDLVEKTGRPIAILERSDNDPGTFWYKAMQSLCDATGDNWCEDDVRFLSDTTNQLGWARVFTYVNEQGVTKTVCALLPPRPGITAGYASTAVSGGRAFAFHEVPDNIEMEAWLWYLHMASCQNDTGSELEQTRAAVFATMTLTLVQADAQFVGAYDVSPSRRFNQLRSPTQTRWATNVGERLLLEHWKRQVADQLRSVGCNVSVAASSDLNTDYIQRTNDLGSTCFDQGAGYSGGQVTDANLWLWTRPSNPYGITMSPPAAPLGMFFSRTAAMDYIWDTSVQLAR